MVEQQILTPKWGCFDKEWYKSRYKSMLSTIEDRYSGDAYVYYQKEGSRIGHSPNPYFDEQWYLQRYQDAVDFMANGEFLSGFDHYCQEGYQSLSPHWLFSEEQYCEKYAQDNNQFSGYRNGYDHYLSEGDFKLYSGSLFFNPELYLAQQDNKDAVVKKGPYQYLLGQSNSDCNVFFVSWFFDPKWYLSTYPEVQKLLNRKVFTSCLHHYFVNNTPTAFCPLASFSEAFYIENNADVVMSIAPFGLRNGYDHFVLYGCSEGRQPSENFDLSAHIPLKKAQEEVAAGIYYNTFEYWVAHQNISLLKQIEHQKVEAEEKPNDSILGVEDILDISGLLDNSAQQDVVSKPKKKANKKVVDLIDAVIKGEDTVSQIEVTLNKVNNLQKVNLSSWKDFDAEWYLRRYSEVTSHMTMLELDSVEEYYLSFGRYDGHSPNPYFDESWYLKKYPDVSMLVQNRSFASGFEHYCKKGYYDHSPHWLFSEVYYRKNYDHLTDENLQECRFINGYDHYLRAGDAEGLSGSIFFDPEFFIGHCNFPIQPGIGAYAHYLRYMDTIDSSIPSSWYFDPVWYINEYPHLASLIENKSFLNALHHYLTNNDALPYAPLLWFDEQFYNGEYADELAQRKASLYYRNGYDHFLHEGMALLWKPCQAVDLEAFSQKKEIKEDLASFLYPNIFVCWLAKHQQTENGVKLPNGLDSEGQQVTTDEKKQQVKDINNALWAQFDEKWYLANYPDIKKKMKTCGLESVENYYYQIGALLGHSPNPYFDERWYIFVYHDVKKHIHRGIFKTGFDHYCKLGYVDRSPHWLFSDLYYLQQNPNFGHEIYTSNIYVNAYDHYLKKGDDLRRSGSIFFDPLVYERSCYQQGNIEKASSPFKNYLYNLMGEDKDINVSLYFDTKWYLGQYPEVAEYIKNGIASCALQHYFANETPLNFSPSAWFIESFYLDSYPDLSSCIVQDGSGTFRNGYTHFVAHGSLELRNPHPAINLKTYYLSGHVRDDLEDGLYRDAYAHWIFNRKLQEFLEAQPDHSAHRLSQETARSKAYFRKKAQYILPIVAHKKLDFSYTGTPDISVVILLRNQLPVTLTALASLRATFSGKIQLLLGDNFSTDDTQYIGSCLIGAQITRFPYNLGYGKACNHLIKQVEAPIVVFLNNDINLYPGAINALCQRLLSSDDIGAVGGKIIHPDGNLQEAGSIVWRDGSTLGYLRGKSPLVPEANFVRDVDYCSTAMMAIKTPLLQQLKGFSPIYYPAYFEDTDLCLRIIQAGYRVVYDPDAVIEHMEYASSDPIVSSGLMRRNHQKFIKEHTDFLRFQKPNHPDNILVARQRIGNTKRILFIEDRIPLRRLGSGYVRSNDIICQMAKLGYMVTVYPINPYYSHLYQIYSDLPETIEILYDHTIDTIQGFFKERAAYYDYVWIGRTHNLNRLLPMIGEASRYLPQDNFILDTEVIAAPRAFLRADILGVEMGETLAMSLEAELSCARHCQEIIAVNDIDAKYVRESGFNNISILGHMMPVRATPKTWDERKDILFIGALHDDLSPNFDGLQWFVSNVLSILIEKMGTTFTVTIAGYVHPSVNMAWFAKYPQVVLLGSVDNLTDLYNNHRVYIAPTRFAGGIPYKLHEAASFGIPIVATELLVRQLGWQDDDNILAAPIDDASFFAMQIVRLYNEQELWEKVRQSALERIKKECSEEVFQHNLQSILKKVILHK